MYNYFLYIKIAKWFFNLIYYIDTRSTLIWRKIVISIVLRSIFVQIFYYSSRNPETIRIGQIYETNTVTF